MRSSLYGEDALATPVLWANSGKVFALRLLEIARRVDGSPTRTQVEQALVPAGHRETGTAGLTMDFKSGDDLTMALDLETQDTVEETTPEKGKKPEKAVSMAKQDKGSEELVAEAAGAAMAGAMAEVAKAAASDKDDSKKILDRRFTIVTDASRDELLTAFGKETLEDRYLLPGEGYQDLFARVADAFADDQDHAQRLYDYISKLWFMPATPVLSNGGTTRGLPISCYLNSVSDSLDGIVNP